MGRKANKFFEEHGAINIYKYGEGDADVLIEDDFNEWKEGMWTVLKEKV